MAISLRFDSDGDKCFVFGVCIVWLSCAHYLVPWPPGLPLALDHLLKAATGSQGQSILLLACVGVRLLSVCFVLFFCFAVLRLKPSALGEPGKNPIMSYTSNMVRLLKILSIESSVTGESNFSEI